MSVPINRDSDKKKDQHNQRFCTVSPGRSFSNTVAVDGQRIGPNTARDIRQQIQTTCIPPRRTFSPQGGASSLSPPVESTRARKPAASHTQDKQTPPNTKSPVQRTVTGMIEEHSRGVGLTDFKSLLKNFRVRSITERVVHPDGTRYEIQIDGEETDEWSWQWALHFKLLAIVIWNIHTLTTCMKRNNLEYRAWRHFGRMVRSCSNFLAIILCHFGFYSFLYYPVAEIFK